jgi:ribosomal protein S18 acetylase RimI-like enzyme
MYRIARIDDLDQLVSLENACFMLDKLSRRSFRHLLTKAQAVTLIEEEHCIIRGCVVLLFHAQRKSLSRVYSCASLPAYRRLSICENLLKYAEQIVLAKQCHIIRAEIRQDNIPSLRLFEKSGYVRFDTIPDYYQDKMTAIRFEKRLSFPTQEI